MTRPVTWGGLLRKAVVLASSAAMMFVAAAPADARKPITGVTCGDGFFVSMSDGRVFWIHGEPARKELVHSGKARLVAMAMCDTGVLTVFEDKTASTLSRAYYSPDCRNIGENNGNSVSLASSPSRVRKIEHRPEETILHFVAGDKITNPMCTRRNWE